MQDNRDAREQSRSRSSEKGELRRAELVAAGLARLLEGGWPAVTHRKVAEGAGANPALVHYHFGNAAGLREAIAENISAQLLSPLLQQPLRFDNASELTELLLEAVDLVDAERDGLILLVQVMAGSVHYPEVGAVIRRDLSEARLKLTEALLSLDDDWTREGAETVASLVIATVDGVFLHAAVDANFSSHRLTSALRSAISALLSISKA